MPQSGVNTVNHYFLKLPWSRQVMALSGGEKAATKALQPIRGGESDEIM